MATSEPLSYSAACLTLLDEHRPFDLLPTAGHQSAFHGLKQLALGDLFARQPLIDPSAARCCLAGLWLWHDFLDESHEISQQIDTPEGSYWHAIMHRREGDFGNSKYWYRRVGNHPVFAILHPSLSEIVNRQSTNLATLPDACQRLCNKPDWDPYLFVDSCASVLNSRRAGSKDPIAYELCVELAKREWRLLFDHCYQTAVGRSK